jgi:hypothetical protein
MRVARATVLMVVVSLVAPTAVLPVLAQIELDRIVSRVDGRPITQSDVRQARALRLVDDTSSDEATLQALEDRWLMLGEIARASPLRPVPDQAVAARVAEWRAATAGNDPSSSPLPLGELELRSWFRDELRIRAYLERRFAALPPADRSRAQADWMARLRQRAELD